MDDETDDRLHVVQDLFALITALCEDAAGQALDGQGCSESDTIDGLTGRLCEAGQRIMIVASGIRAIPLP